MNRLPKSFKYYLAYVRNGLEMAGPYDVLSNNTLASTPIIQKAADDQFPGVGFANGEVTFIESQDEPDDDLVEEILRQL